jgi:hypothetical protein
MRIEQRHEVPMNHYGSQAMTHWRRWLPTRYATIPNPAEFFEDLGQQVQTEIAQLSTQLAAEDSPGESYLDKVGRLKMARMQAEEIVLRERVLLEPEPGADPEARDTDASEEPPSEATDGWTPLIEDATSPYWQQVRERATNEPPTR